MIIIRGMLMPPEDYKRVFTQITTRITLCQSIESRKMEINTLVGMINQGLLHLSSYWHNFNSDDYPFF